MNQTSPPQPPAPDSLDLVEAYVEGLLAPEPRAEFEDRMRQDPALRREVEKARKTGQLITDAFDAITPGSMFETTVATRITGMNDVVEGEFADDQPGVPLSLKLLFGIVALAVVATVIVILLLIFN